MADGSAEDDAEQQADERCALEAIYGEGFLQGVGDATYRACIPSAAAQPHLALTLHLPARYPSLHPPVFQLQCDYVPSDALDALASRLEALFVPGCVCLYDWIECLREGWLATAPPAPEPGAPAPEAAAAEEGAPPSSEQQLAAAKPDGSPGGAPARLGVEVLHGEPFTEKKSTFQAHLAAVSCMEEVEAFKQALLANAKVRGAHHNILAYRIPLPGRGDAFLQDCDDGQWTGLDAHGESAAGGRLLHLLQITDARGVAVVVTRWYGGVLLGPARFTHINNAARVLLVAAGYVAGGGGGGRAAKGAKAGKR